MSVQQSTFSPQPRERTGYVIPYGNSRGRTGHSDTPGGVSVIHRVPWWRQCRTEARLGLLISGVGLIWATKVQTIEISNIFRLLLTPGPVEMTGIGLIVWLHAKWRRSVRVK